MPDLVGGRLQLAVNFEIDHVGFEPQLLSMQIEYPGGIVFDFSLVGASLNGMAMPFINIPPVDYSGVVNQNATVRLVYNFSGVQWIGAYTIVGMVNTNTGPLHDSVIRLAEMVAQQAATTVNSRIDTLVGNIDNEGNLIADLNVRASGYRNQDINTPYTNTRYLDSTGADNPPETIAEMDEVDIDLPRFSVTGTDAFIAVQSGGSYALLNITADSSILLDDIEATVDVEASKTFEGSTWFVYRVSGLTAGNVYELDQTRQIQVPARPARH